VSRSARVASYRLHKPSGQAIVTIGKRMFYLGCYDSVESRAEYARVLAERQANGNATPVTARGSAPPAGTITVGELLRDSYRHAEQYYVKNGEVTNQVRMIRLAFKAANVLYGDVQVADVGPLALKACRAAFVKQGLSRGECNRRTNLIRQAFRWGTENELVPPAVYQAIGAVAGLRKGRCEAPRA
jgi:hypothetical protein